MHSPGGPLIPIGPRLPGSPLGPAGPGSPRAPTRSGGRKRISRTAPALLGPAPAPPTPAPTISREQRGPLVFSGSRQPWGGGAVRRGSVLPRVSAPAPPAAGPPWTPVLRGPWGPTGELGRLRPEWRSGWEPAAARAGISLPLAHSHTGACTPLTHSPRRLPSPGLPWTAGEPQSGAGSSGAPGVGGTARSVTVSTATCGGRGQWGGYQCLTGDRPARPVEAGLGGQAASRTLPGVETRLTGAQNFIRTACGFPAAQFITFIV